MTHLGQLHNLFKFYLFVTYSYLFIIEFQYYKCNSYNLFNYHNICANIPKLFIWGLLLQ